MAKDVGGIAATLATGGLTLAWALKITRPTDSAVFGFTDHDADHTIDGVLYQAAPGLDVSSFVNRSGLAVANNELTVLEDDAVFTRTSALAGDWAGALYEAFQFDWTNPSAGKIFWPCGRLGNIQPKYGSLVAELRDWRQALQQDTSANFQETCRARLGDANCTVDLAPWTTAFTVTELGDDSQSFVADALSGFIDDRFGYGLVRWTGGANADRVHKIRSSTTEGEIQLETLLIDAVQVGDTGDAVAGCRGRHQQDCRDKFANVLNFQAEPAGDGSAIGAIAGGSGGKPGTDAAVDPPSEQPAASPPPPAPAPSPAPAPAPAPSPAPAPAPAPVPPSTGKPNTCVVGWKMRRPSSVADGTTLGNQHGRAKFIFCSFYYGLPAARIDAYTAAARARETTKIVQYWIPSEMSDSSPNTPYRNHVNRIRSDGKDGWMRNAAGQRGAEFVAHVQYEINLTDAVPNLDGKSTAQWNAEQFVDLFGGRDFDGALMDNVFTFRRAWKTPSSGYDWNRDGANDAIGSSTATDNVKFRNGRVAWRNAIKAMKPSWEIWGNTSGTNLDMPEYAGKWNGGMLEGAQGFFFNNGGGAAKFMERYLAHEANSINGQLIIEFNGSPTDYNRMRLGLAMTLMRNGGYFFYYQNGNETHYWYDEFDKVIGSPVDAPQSAAWVNGVWKRKYQNHVLLANPTTSSRTVPFANLQTLGGLKRITGSQDPSTNNGATVSGDIVLPANSGLMLERT